MALELLLAAALASLLLHVARATVDNTTASCAPARCGNLSISYPFSLSGVQPRYCGVPALRLTCNDGRRAYLDMAFTEHRSYRVQDISYDNSSLVVSVAEAAAFAGDETCGVPDFNVSSGLSRLPLKVSDAANRNLTFVYNCEVPPSIRLPRPCANHTMGAYVSDGDELPSTGVPTNCSFVSVPVRELHDGMEPAPYRYEELIRDGFLLEWMAAGDCAACRRSGAECRFVQQSFQCFCHDELLCSTTPQGIDSTARKIIVKVDCIFSIDYSPEEIITISEILQICLHKYRNKSSETFIADIEPRFHISGTLSRHHGTSLHKQLYRNLLVRLQKRTEVGN